jgi:hypothetical protein
MQDKLPCTSARGAARAQGAGAQSPAMPNGRCLHGRRSPGAPKGNRNAFKHVRYTTEAIAAAARVAATHSCHTRSGLRYGESELRQRNAHQCEAA